MKRLHDDTSASQLFKRRHLAPLPRKSQFKTDNNQQTTSTNGLLSTIEKDEDDDDSEELQEVTDDHINETRMVLYNPDCTTLYYPFIPPNILKIIKSYSIDQLREYINSQDSKTKEYLKDVISKNPDYAKMFNQLLLTSSSPEIVTEQSEEHKIEELNDKSTEYNTPDSDEMMIDSDSDEGFWHESERTYTYDFSQEFGDKQYFDGSADVRSSGNKCYNNSYEPRIVDALCDDDSMMMG